MVPIIINYDSLNLNNSEIRLYQLLKTFVSLIIVPASSMTFGGGEEDRYSTCSEVSSVQDLEDPPPNMLGTLLSEIYTQVLTPLLI